MMKIIDKRTELNVAKDLFRNKVTELYAVILFANKAKNADITVAMARIFNAVDEQKNP